MDFKLNLSKTRLRGASSWSFAVFGYFTRARVMRASEGSADIQTWSANRTTLEGNA